MGLDSQHGEPTVITLDGSLDSETHLRLDGDNSTAEAITCFVQALARDAGLPRGEVYWLRLAVEEIITSIVEHGYKGTGPIWLAGGVKPDRVWLRIKDTAPAFDPRTHLSALHELDGFSYKYADGKNCSTLIALRRRPGMEVYAGSGLEPGMPPSCWRVTW
jgi:hypothetical protein